MTTVPGNLITGGKLRNELLHVRTNFSSFPWNKSTLNVMTYLEKKRFLPRKCKLLSHFLNKI